MMTHNSKTRIPKVAVIGSGYWGKNLVRNLDRLGALAMICGKIILLETIPLEDPLDLYNNDCTKDTGG